MNDHQPAAAASAAPSLNFARVARLARKELRETLRDRRTILTLVVMPLLVYPVLSVALKQFLLTATSQETNVRLIIRSDTQEELLALAVLMDRGDRLIEQREPSSPGTPLAAGPILGSGRSGSELPFAENNVSALSPEEREKSSLEDQVREGKIDLGVRLTHVEKPQQARAEARFQLIYRPNTPLSRQAADFVERRLRAVNEQDLRRRLAKAGDQAPLKTGWRLIPVADEQGHSFWLGALMPLVLILMTITGAVYPAIDLTAGERERGTLESLMAAPVPRLELLIAKYIAVVTVATLTAVVNMTAMTATVAAFGLWTFFFGNQGSPAEAILSVFLLLILFAMFFSAVLLLVTSFARSFKEAQAYVVPLMVVALAPGFMSVMPGLTLGPLMSVLPLTNIVLLTRDVMEGNAPIIWGTVAVLTTLLYGGVALALAGRVFGSDAILYGSEGTWADLFRRPKELRRQATVTDALSTLAVITPLYVIASGLLAMLQGIGMIAQLMAAAGTTLIIFVAVPMMMARYQGVAPRSGFQLSRANPLFFVAAAILGATLWPLAYDSIILCQQLGLATLSSEKLAEHRPALLAMVEKLRAVPPWIVLPCLAAVPGIAEELFFRGYLLGAARGKLRAWLAIGLTGLVFGLFHASVGGLIAVERVLSSTFLGLVLGWICWTTGSVFPGMILHILNNGLLLSLLYFGPQLQERGWDIEDQSYLPLPLVFATTVVASVTGVILAVFARRRQQTQTAPA
ncbi:MAG TPA: ABC transporter permease subunit/CPBP intramembrane protease [Pirellulaceae bacterium]|jgi:ABC-2 type transport system permease protein/sodium transport system permease protein